MFHSEKMDKEEFIWKSQLDPQTSCEQSVRKPDYQRSVFIEKTRK